MNRTKHPPLTARSVALLVCALLVPVVHGPSSAAAAERLYPRMHALCIGINDYSDPAISDLNYAENDARAFARLLVEQYGFDSVELLLGAKATKEGIGNAVATFFDGARIGRDDAVLIYYSGHGQTIDLPGGGEMGFLVPQDARVDLNNPANTGAFYVSCIPMQSVRDWRALIPARHVMVIADACYSGMLAAARSGGTPRPIEDAVRLSVCQILTAGTRGQVAREFSNTGHGAYTGKLLEALGTGVADLNKDGYVRGSELGQYLRDVNIPGQTPQAKVMDGEGDFILQPLPTARRRRSQLELESPPGESSRAVVVVQAINGLTPASTPTPIDTPQAILATPMETPVVTIAPTPQATPAFQGETYVEDHAGLGLQMIWVPGGSFLMGDEGYRDEQPVRQVVLDGFWMAETEITQRQYAAIMGENPSRFTGDDLPVHQVSWNAALTFCQKLSEATGHLYVLPTEAQWEYAARAGTQTEFFFGGRDDWKELKDYGWFDRSAHGRIQPVAALKPNPWGFHDMHGNVWEWCLDWYRAFYREGSPVRNPLEAAEGSERVLRGGSAMDGFKNARVSNRKSHNPGFSNVYFGFRVVRRPQP